MKKVISRFVEIAAVASLVGCGGGGSASTAPNVPVATTNPYTSGTLAVDGSTSVSQPAGNESGALFFAPTPSLAAIGQLGINDPRAANTDSVAFDSSDDVLAINNAYLGGSQSIVEFVKGSLGATSAAAVVVTVTSPASVRRLAIAAGGQLVYIQDTDQPSGTYASSSIQIMQRSAGAFTATRAIAGPATGLSGTNAPAVTCDGIDGNGNVYAGTANGVLVFPATQNGDGAPVTRISVAGGVSALALAKDGSLAVISGASLLVFPAGASTASRTITGSTTGLSRPGALAFDASDGLYVVDSGSIAYFPSTANGNVAPLQTAVVSNGASVAVAIAP